MKYKLVIFDFDGTLADTFPYFLSVINRLADKYHVARVDGSQIETLRGYDAHQILKLYRISLLKMTLAGRDYRRMMFRDIHQIPLFPGIDQLLEGLAENGVRLALVSSNGKKIIREVLGPQNAARISHFECGVSILGKGKKIRKVLRKCGVRAGEAIYIGDEIRDMHAARSAGVAFGAVAWGYTLPAALQAHSPSVMFESVEDMLSEIVEE